MNRNGHFVAFAEADGDKPCFAVFKRQDLFLYDGYKPLNCTEKSDSVVYTTGLDDVDGYYELLKSRNVELLGEPQNMHGWQYRCFYFRDPEGNLFEVAGPIK